MDSPKNNCHFVASHLAWEANERTLANAVITHDYSAITRITFAQSAVDPKPQERGRWYGSFVSDQVKLALLIPFSWGTWRHFKSLTATRPRLEMIYLILISAFSGALVTLVLQFLFLYRRSQEPIGRTVQYVKAVPDPLLKDYFNNHHVESGQQQQENTTSAASKQAEAASPKPQEASVSSSPKQQPPPPSQSESLNTSKSETCGFLNAIFLFLFRELRDTPVVRHWVTKKIKVEFEELLQTKTAGRLLEGLSLRDISLGNSLPVFKTAKLMKPVAVNEDGMPEELNFEVDLEYNGGFHLAIDVDLVFGKSAYLFVKMTRVVGRLKLQFTRMPFTHWSFSFLEDPLIDFEVKSQFEGRPLPQLTSIIVNQLKRVIKKKHTLPNYKIR